MSKINVIFRVDASVEVGIGHLMRCLTLASKLSRDGARTRFVCRHLPEYLNSLLIENGHEVIRLVVKDLTELNSHLVHASWLGVNQDFDAEETASVISDLSWDLLVVDHYAIDIRWENALRHSARNLMVIDDLADRLHNCDLLLDQTLGRESSEYQELVPAHCIVLTGSDYILLRPDFMRLRDYSLARRRPAFEHIMVAMGGVDRLNVTSSVLLALKQSELPTDCRISVVLGSSSPSMGEVKAISETMLQKADVFVNVENMAELIAESDWVIGAAGTTSWERCCLGVPSVMAVLAQNQHAVALSLQSTGAVWLIDKLEEIESSLQAFIQNVLQNPEKLTAMSQAAAVITDGAGVNRVACRIEGVL